MNSNEDSPREQFLKLILIAVLLLISSASCGLPILVIHHLLSRRRREENKEKRLPTLNKWMSRISCFAGGVFLTVGFMNLFPDVLKAFEEAELHSDYPFASLCILVGFFVILLVEQVVTVIRQRDSASDQQNMFKTFTLLLAISLNSLCKGFALGLQTPYNQTVLMFLTLSLHKVVIGLCIGINLAKLQINDSPRSKTIFVQVSSVLTLALATPIGILIGLGLLGVGDLLALHITKAILHGIACGTFIFSVFCEILRDEVRPESTDQLVKLAWAFLGFVSMAVFIYFLPA
ncbi:hypothetical protein Ciccas_008391 [Cichlidogyrus casuarinus]|uniref:Uncharacterized protein n=1 Tax=Cichlidogyrus casuarinus TaxID=1844966 RepID=A0ABD2Q4B2_9PLAT